MRRRTATFRRKGSQQSKDEFPREAMLSLRATTTTHHQSIGASKGIREAVTPAAH
jgi:hypothetical protein